MIRHAYRLLILTSLTLSLFLGVQLPVSAQETTSEHPPASRPDSPVPQPQSHLDRTIDRQVSIYKLLKNILQDQVTVFSFPRKFAKGEHWWPTIGITGVTAGFIASDPYST